MPELPEVETLRRELTTILIGQIIKSVEIFWPKIIVPLSPARFARELKNRKIESVERRAKILFLNLDNDASLAIHLKMTGQLVYRPSTSHKLKAKKLIVGGHPEDPTKYTRAIFTFADNSQLYFNDLRKFGWLRLLTEKEGHALVAKHGLEPLAPEFSLTDFVTKLKQYPNRKLKQALLDQTLVAGLGNIYVDESCFAAALRPARRVKTLAPNEIKKLHHAIKKILRLAIVHGGTSTRNYVRSNGQLGGFVPYLKVYGRAGQPCKNCQTLITKIKLAGRGTHFCLKCQK